MKVQAAVHKAFDLKFQLTQRVDSHKDRKHTSRQQCTREDLDHHGAISAPPDAEIKLTIVSEPYPPSHASLQTLTKINLSDLSLEAHHYGSFLLLRTFGHSTDVSKIQTFMPVEDETGDVDRIAILNFGLVSWPERYLPAGVVLAIKEPFYSSVSEDLAMALCVYHPSDIIFLEIDHSLFPSAWQSSAQPKLAMKWKFEGNQALKEKDYIKAGHCYTKGLTSMTHKDPDLKSDLLRNRAQARLLLGCYEAAKADAIASTKG
ncbi:hypothetical protein E4T38_06461 [Aureobasidium subglaciale]|nr:hypothetical protein E4T38_06461 [Aureobasidium subglaciale]KAI5219293.1 hypothetical protein E4T40_06483 [Aureobasidium subglaciale]KAI5223020.1 hypothetical protein E4T41_06323 [Aureobasidium subglaciale]KAI5260328.1 hypothetical protein E4T46_06113 [Aureobasidium subglaciale]